MQQIERYGVIALVFLLVTIVAISFWGDSKSPGFWSRLTGKNQPKEVAKVEEAPVALPPTIADPNVPLSETAPIAGDVTPIHPLGTPLSNSPIETPGIGGGTLQNDVASFPPTSTEPLVVPGGATMPNVVTPTQPVNAGTTEYVVARGDSLARIARKQLGAESRWEEIAALNPSVNPKALDVDQKIMLPAGAAPQMQSTAKATEPKPSASKPKSTTKSAPKPKAEVAEALKKSTGSTRGFVVKKGDTLRSIARNELGDERRWKDIVTANPGLDPQKLAIGMRIKLPGSEALLVAAAPSGSTKAVQSTSKPRVQ